jgi:hypothetical protein
MSRSRGASRNFSDPLGSTLVGVRLTIDVPDPVAERLASEAARRGVSPAEVAVEALESVYGAPESGDDALEAFIGCGSSGRPEPFDITQARSYLAARRPPRD